MPISCGRSSLRGDPSFFLLISLVCFFHTFETASDLGGTDVSSRVQDARGAEAEGDEPSGDYHRRREQYAKIGGTEHPPQDRRRKTNGGKNGRK